MIRSMLILLSVVLLTATPCLAETWKADFERLCGYTEEATNLSTDQIKELIVESDNLLKRIQKVDLPEKKVYIFRLKKCRNFFEYILTLREVDKSQSEEMDSSHEVQSINVPNRP
jgi:hypothetical protein